MNDIYLDHAATSPMHPEVIQVMTDTMSQVYGNPSSIYGIGRESRKYLDDARAVISKSIGAKASEIVFTSGGSEADNLAIFGTAHARQQEGRHIITTQIEHHAVLRACERLENDGFEVTYLPVDSRGMIAIDDLKNALRNDTILVTIMYGNNEVGTVQPIAEIGQLLKNHPATFHTDAVQAYGIEQLNVDELGVDLLSTSAHKLNGPKGIGFLYERASTKIDPLLVGGDQERKRRASTENVPAIIGFAKAVELAQQSMQVKQQQFEQYRNFILQKLDEAQISYHTNGDALHALPHLLNISFKGMDVESFLVNLDMAGVAVSSGSACTAGSLDPSHVLVAMYGKGAEELRNSIRISFGYGLDDVQIERATQSIVTVVERFTK
ncbi:cysteine desulfurase [Kurthia zopfii]|uniref:cysteine desulfurase n=1 Tax=Kurthia zopfii TaxID=1650 RepID=A0A8B4QBP5_9BACL|nr:cysteine desulfurase family protein [Kurthia zopfii]PWI24028.1 cysteine desulfurase NifS [Kurthia zopfii]TDR44282.1 cysteine desulfurase [Kurthia zopfii]GEK29762.1 cysteine desulfurase [Kurthia zopfii]STX10112.1 Cysteine desulfurase [Kurthia zopfii]